MTTDLVAVSDALAPEMVPISSDDQDVCPLCRSGRTSPVGLCFSCERTTAQVGHPCEIVIPISYYTTPSRLRDRMHDYKEHQSDEVRAIEARNVASILGRYVTKHREPLAAKFGTWDAVVAVPSTHHAGLPALQVAVETHFPGVVGPFERHLVQGAGDMGFNRAAEDGFALRPGISVNEKRLLLVDDTYTTGARLHSAHHALAIGGAVVVAAIVVTRKITPDARYGSETLWARQSSVPFSFTSIPWWAARDVAE